MFVDSNGWSGYRSLTHRPSILLTTTPDRDEAANIVILRIIDLLAESSHLLACCTITSSIHASCWHSVRSLLPSLIQCILLPDRRTPRWTSQQSDRYNCSGCNTMMSTQPLLITDCSVTKSSLVLELCSSPT